MVIGDITKQPNLSAIVNAANTQLMPGGGVTGAIHRAAGKAFAEVCRSLAPIKPGEAVIAEAFNLPNEYVIHCLGPIYGIDEPFEKLLIDCYKNALKIADENKISSIAFPAISTGAFGYPNEKAAAIALNTIVKESSEIKKVKSVRMVLFDTESFSIHENVFETLIK